MIYSGIVFSGFALVALALGFVGLAPGAAGVVNVALLMSMGFFLAAAILGQRHLLSFPRGRRTDRADFRPAGVVSRAQ